MENIIEEIKSRLDIVEVVKEYVNLKKTGANYSALCPFHSEKTPSFFVSPSKQIWHCFGSCSEGGDVFKFIMKIEGVEFGDALRILAKKAGVELKKEDPKLASKRSSLYEINELACKFFEKHLWQTDLGKKALDYLVKRGLKKETIKEWRIGLAPFKENKLSNFLISRGFLAKEVSQAGLLIFKDPSNFSSFKDRFRGRIIFPIFSLASQVIGFGGRLLEEKSKEPKYLNIPNTLLYDKSKALYGLDKAKVNIRQEGSCVLAEGYLDVILAWQAGTKNVVATSGTALTEDHLNILKRYTQRLIFAFDSDLAGKSATRRGVNLAQVQGFEIKVALLPKGKDPADLVKENPSLWLSLVKEPRDIIEFAFESAFGGVDVNKLSAEEKAKLSFEVLPYLKRIQNKIVQDHWIGKLAQILKVQESSIREELKKYKIEEGGEVVSLKKEEKTLSNLKKTRKELLEERVLAILIKNPSLIKEVLPEAHSFLSQKSLDILSYVKNLDDSGKISDNLIIEALPKEYRDLVKIILLKAEVENLSFSLESLKFFLKELQKVSLKEKLSEVSAKIKEAERENNLEELPKLIEQFNKISRELSNF